MDRDTNNKLIVIGAGAYAREIIDVAEAIGYDIEGVVSDVEPDFRTNWIGTFSDLELISRKNISFFFAIGATDRKSIQKRGTIFNETALNNIKLVNIISQNALVAKTVRFGKNNYIAPGVVINSDAILNDNVLINNNATIGHNVTIGTNSIISGNVFIGGGTSIGSNVLIGPGANILQGLSISDQAIISVGATVLRSLKEGQTVYPNFNTIIP